MNDIQFYPGVFHTPTRENDYGVPWLRNRIMQVIPPHWVTCDEIIVMVFGEGPYSLDEAKALNKVQTVCKALWEKNQLDRATDGSLLHYRRNS